LGKKAGAVVFVVLLLAYLYIFNAVKIPSDTGAAAMVVGIVAIIIISVVVARKR
jgi:hypothetical protein